MTISISGEQVVKNARQLAADSPGFVYMEGRPESSCLNYETGVDGRPIPRSGCIVGRALEMVDVNLDHITQDADAESVIMELTARSGLYNVHFSDEQVYWLSYVQTSQDSGSTWADAVNKADNIDKADDDES